MPLCPACSYDFQRRKRIGENLCCPECEIALWKHGDEWIDNDNSSYPVQLLELFKELWSKRHGGATLIFDWKQRILQLSMAKRYLAQCSDNFELASEALEVQMLGAGMTWKTRDDFRFLFHDMAQAKARAIRKIQKRQREQQKSQDFIDIIMDMENVFDNL